MTPTTRRMVADIAQRALADLVACPPMDADQEAWLAAVVVRERVLEEDMDITYCDAEAQDDPRFAYAEDTFSPPAGTWAPDCGHAACVADDAECVTYGGRNWHEWDCPVATCRWDTARATCYFTVGHTGDHSYALRMLPTVPAPAAPGTTR